MSSKVIPRRAALAGLLALAGCGFTPVYRDGGALRGRIAYSTPDTVAGFRLRNRLIDRLGAPEQPDLRLTVAIRSSERAAAIAADGETLRVNIVGQADWQLRDAGGALVSQGTADAFTSYSTSASTVATQSTQDDATARLSVLLADLIGSRLLVLSSDQPA